jgi:hypothetical protein
MVERLSSRLVLTLAGKDIDAKHQHASFGLCRPLSFIDTTVDINLAHFAILAQYNILVISTTMSDQLVREPHSSYSTNVADRPYWLPV